MSNRGNSLLQVDNLSVWFPVGRSFSLFRRRKYVHAVDGVSFDVRKGDVLSIVGESGAGKSTLGLTIVGVYKPTKGRILFKGIDIHNTDKKTAKTIRRKIQMIFQDPFEALPPHMTVLDIVSEGIDIHKLAESPADKIEMVSKALEQVGITPPEDFLGRYPHQLSGGQRQRIAIASTLVLQPELLVADEPVSMLDASLRGSIINLMMDLKESLKLTYIFILHNLALARCVSTRIAVMYLGQIVELGEANEVIGDPLHPYTKALISVVPSLRGRRRDKKIILKGEIPNPINLPSGCRFHPRCPEAFDKCAKEEPQLVKIKKNHYVKCLLYQ